MSWRNVCCRLLTCACPGNASCPPTEGQCNGDKHNADHHHQQACAPWSPHLPAECETGEEQHRDSDKVRKPQSEGYVVDTQERDSNREQTEKDKQEDAEGGQIVQLAERGIEALGRDTAEMDADLLEVGLVSAGKTTGGRCSATIVRPAAGLSTSRTASTAERANWRSPRTPIRYMTASMMAQARLHPAFQ